MPGQMRASTHHSMPETAQDIKVDMGSNAQPPRDELVMNDALLVEEAHQHHTLLTQGCSRLLRALGIGLQPLGGRPFGCWIIGHEPAFIPCDYGLQEVTPVGFEAEQIIGNLVVALLLGIRQIVRHPPGWSLGETQLLAQCLVHGADTQVHQVGDFIDGESAVALQNQPDLAQLLRCQLGRAS